MSVSVDISMGVHVCERKKTTLNFIPELCSTSFPESSLALDSLTGLGYLTSKLQEFICLYLPSAETKQAYTSNTVPRFFYGF